MPPSLRLLLDDGEGLDADPPHDGQASQQPWTCAEEVSETYAAARAFLAAFGRPGTTGITVEAARKVGVTRTAAHAILAVLETLEVRCRADGLFVSAAAATRGCRRAWAVTELCSTACRSSSHAAPSACGVAWRT